MNWKIFWLCGLSYIAIVISGFAGFRRLAVALMYVFCFLAILNFIYIMKYVIRGNKKIFNDWRNKTKKASIFDVLKENYKPLPIQPMSQARVDSLEDNISTYRYRYTTVSIAFAGTAVLIIVLYQIAIAILEPSSGLTTLMSTPELIIWLIGIILTPIIPVIYVARLLLYSVRIDKTGVKIIIKGFSTKNFLLDEISTVELVIKLNGRKNALVKLVDGKKYFFDSSLKNFPELFHILKEHCPA